MDHSAVLHGNIFILFIILHLALRSCPEPLESFSPLNVEVYPDPHHQQRLIVEWDFIDRFYTSGLNVTFHIQVARSGEKNIIHDEYYNTSLSGSGKPFSWLWDSDLPLECDSHSFRIRTALLQDSFPFEQYWSTWSLWKTHHGKNEENRKNIVIYPYEKIVPEGSEVSFCCLPGPSEKVQEMTFKRQPYPSRSQQMKTESFVITVKNVLMTRSDGDNIICRVHSMGKRRQNGTVLVVSRPPDEPKDFSCETNDLQSIQCNWRPGHIYNFYGHLAEKYILEEWISGRSASCSRENCTWPIVRNQQIYNFTLNVKNRMGAKSIQAIVDVAERVRPVAPTCLRKSDVNATEARLIWRLEADYTSLVLRCQTDLQERTVNVTLEGKTSLESYSVSLTHLKPFTKYEVRVRCMSESSLAGWSKWSAVLILQTMEAAPSAPLDVWREIQYNENNQTVTLYWKRPPGFSANGIISEYNIECWPLGGDIKVHKTTVFSPWNSAVLKLGRQAHAIRITAKNGAGVSPAAEIKVPGSGGSGNVEVKTEQTNGGDKGINVMWRPAPAVHGYVVEWCNSPRSPYCDLQWKKYNSSIHRDVIQSESFQPGVRYNFRIYGSTEDGEHLLGKLTGYTEELVSSKKPKVVTTSIDANSLSLDWFPYPIDETQEGFLMGYTIYVKTSGRNCDLDASNDHIILDGLQVCRFFIEDPKIMNATIRQLKPSTEYQLAVVAVTGGGETNKEFIKASTQSDAGAMIMSILLPVIILSVLVVILLLAGCWKRAWLKEICYPNIPSPNKSKVLSFSSPKGSACISVLQDVSSVPQEVDRVYVLEKISVGHDLKDNNDQQTEVLYSTIQRPTKTSTTETSGDMYFVDTSERGSPLNLTAELLYKPQSPTYLEFFNENYIGTSEDSFEENVGYRPQVGSTQLNPSSCEDPGGHLQDTDLDLGHHLRVTSLSASENEPGSPTSVNSTSFILC